MARARNIHFVPLGQLLPSADEIPAGTIENGHIKGREGTLCIQSAGAA
jgi:hypothetical protein